jgi:nitrile hydratase accessory protein
MDDVRLLSQLPADRVPPRRNGELVFESPWESRAFGLAVALAESEVLDWEDFRAELIAEIARDPDGEYYEHWLTALERAAVSAGLVDAEALLAALRSVLDHREH